MAEHEAEDIQDVREVAVRYVDATSRGDVGALPTGFHEAAAMSGYWGSSC